MHKPSTFGELIREYPAISQQRHMQVELVSFPRLITGLNDSEYDAMFFHPSCPETPLDDKMLYITGMDLLTRGWFSVTVSLRHHGENPTRNTIRSRAVAVSNDLVATHNIWILPSYEEKLHFRDEADAVSFSLMTEGAYTS